jgi:hypothetical protein
MNRQRSTWTTMKGTGRRMMDNMQNTTTREQAKYNYAAAMIAEKRRREE